MLKGKSLIRLFNYLKPYGRLVVGALIMGILGAGISLTFPWLVKIIIDQVLIQKNLLLLLFITVYSKKKSSSGCPMMDSMELPAICAPS